MKIVTGNSVVQDITQHIGGERIEAKCLLPAGTDPHSYQPVPTDVHQLTQAQLVIINGLGFEGWFAGLISESGYKGTVIVAANGIEPLTINDDEHAKHDEHAKDEGHAEHSVYDPHAFNSIRQGIRYAENIRDALQVADPAGDAYFEKMAKQYILQLTAADAEARRRFNAISPAKRKLVTNHDALQYFARDYGFEIIASNTALEDSQPSAQDVARIVAFIRQQGVPSVFLEFGENGKIVEQIARESGVRVGADLYLDGLGGPDTPASTYIGMFMANVDAIASGLR